MEMIRLTKLIESNRTIRNIDLNSIFCSLYDNSFFSIFFQEVMVLQQVLNQLEQLNLQVEEDAEENEVENQVLRRVYYLLSQHNLTQTRYDLNRQSKIVELKDQREKKEEENKVDCNSILYRNLYTHNTKSRDLILQIASLSEQFTLTKVFISIDDLQ